MCRTLAAFLMVILFAPELPARSNYEWENVKRLKRGTSVEILLWTGENLSGAIDGVNDTGLRIAIANVSGAQAGWLRDFDRANIRRVVRVREPSFPNNRRWLTIGALAGGAIGLTTGAIGDAEHGNNGRWIVGGFVGAVVGVLAATVAVGGAGIAEAARGTIRRKVVYEDQSKRLLQTP